MKTHYFYNPLVIKQNKGTPYELYCVNVYKYRRGQVTQVRTAIQKDPLSALEEGRELVKILTQTFTTGVKKRFRL